MSSANFVWPTHFARASTLRKGLPMVVKFLATDDTDKKRSLFEAVDALLREFDFFAAHACGGEFHCLVDFNITGAATQVSG